MCVKLYISSGSSSRSNKDAPSDDQKRERERERERIGESILYKGEWRIGGEKRVDETFLDFYGREKRKIFPEKRLHTAQQKKTEQREENPK